MRITCITSRDHNECGQVPVFIFDHVLRLGFLKRSLKERRSMIEYTTSKELPLVNVYSCRNLKKLLEKSGFTIKSLWVRKLVNEDLPALPLVGRLWRFIPQRWLDFVGKAFGWYVIAKARKD